VRHWRVLTAFPLSGAGLRKVTNIAINAPMIAPVAIDLTFIPSTDCGMNSTTRERRSGGLAFGTVLSPLANHVL
jgi:hypothetical protein